MSTCNLYRQCLMSVVLLSAGAHASFASETQDVSLNWLGPDTPSVATGVSWGVPWAKGAVSKDVQFAVTTADGKGLPVQTWPLAYWPDGSLKWSGFAAIAGPNTVGPFTLSRGLSPLTAGAVVRVRESDEAITIDTDSLRCRISRRGQYLFDSLTIDNREVARQARLVCILQNGPELDPADLPPRQEFTSEIKSVTVEQSGPVRAVVKVEGMHKSQEGTREWLPFVVRLYFYGGPRPIRLVHSVVFDGDEHRDFIRGLSVVFDVPMREEIQNRHVRFSGEGDGLWAEPIQPLIGRQGRSITGANRRDVYYDQIEGNRVPNREELNARSQNLLSMWAVWDDFRLLQPNANGFTIEKRTNPESCWLPAGAGRRASGLVFAGDISGGLAVGVKDFWQSYPSALEVRNARSEAAQMVVWLWSPEAPAMDLRHYDTVAHGLEEVYEDVQEGFSTPHGVARTSELTLFATAAVPTKIDTAEYARLANEPPLLVATPEYLHSVHAFGFWGLQDRSTPLKRQVEDYLDSTIAYYQKCVEQANWYGFWDFGDVMHSYDAGRHVWRYDLGGMAWDNSELGTDMWLWYSFLRSGRADIFRMAEAMTRHTGEVDSYHLGRFAGLGSRHNVRHWGCGAKEARISQAAYRRFYYYLTTDERTGDVMREMLQADRRVAEIDPMRLAQPINEAERQYPARVRLGPDWLALAGNWLTEWERTGDTRWRDKLYAGMDSLAAMPLGIRSGQNLVMGFDPETGKLYQVSDRLGDYNLSTIMGGAELVFDLNQMVDHEGWDETWLRYCRLYSAPAEVVLRDKQTGAEGADASYPRDGRLAAYVYMKTGNEAFAQRAIRQLGGRGMTPIRTQPVEGPDVLNPIEENTWISTNTVAQNALETIAILGMCADQIPAEAPPQQQMRRGGRGQTRGQ